MQIFIVHGIGSRRNLCQSIIYTDFVVVQRTINSTVKQINCGRVMVSGWVKAKSSLTRTTTQLKSSSTQTTTNWSR